MNKKGFSGLLVIILVIVIFSSISGYFLLKNKVSINNVVKKSNIEGESPFSKLMPVDNNFKFTTQNPPYSAVITGEITKKHFKHNVELEPIFLQSRYTAKDEINSNKSSDFKIEFIDSNGIIKSTYFSPSKCIKWDIDVCTEYDPSQGQFVFSVYNIDRIPNKIAIKYKDKEIYSIESSVENPSIGLTKQEYDKGVLYLEWGPQLKNFDYMAILSYNDFDSGTPIYNSKNNLNNPIIDNSLTIKPGAYSFKGGKFKVKVIATDGVRSWAVVSKTFEGPEFVKKPKALLYDPENGKNYDQDHVLLWGKDGSLSARPTDNISYLWKSNVDGILSKKSRTTCNALTLGQHEISFTVTNNDNNTTDTIKVNITVVDSDNDQELKNAERESDGPCFDL